MSSKGDEIKARIKELASEGRLALLLEEYRRRPEGQDTDSVPKVKAAERDKIAAAAKELPLRTIYQKWYSKALSAVRQLAPDRLDEFTSLYQTHTRKHLDALTFGISDYLQGVTTTRHDSFGMERA